MATEQKTVTLQRTSMSVNGALATTTHDAAEVQNSYEIPDTGVVYVAKRDLLVPQDDQPGRVEFPLAVHCWHLPEDYPMALDVIHARIMDRINDLANYRCLLSESLEKATVAAAELKATREAANTRP